MRAAAPARTALTVAAEALAAVVVAALVVAVGLTAFSVVQWPAFNSSNVTRAVTTVGQVIAMGILAVAVVLARRDARPLLWKPLSWIGLSGFVTVTLGMPLAATKLYLFGVSVDQEFRTEYLTRLTDSPALQDMTYADLPPYYPAGWFWVGGRLADTLGLAGWEAYKPWAIGSLAIAAVIGLVLWSALVRRDLAILAALGVTALILAYASPEAYGAVIAVLIPPMLVLAWGGLHRPGATRGATRGAGWGAVVATGLFLGISATVYTLYLGFTAFAVTLMALTSAVLRYRATRSARAVLDPAVRLVAIAALSGLLALTVWAPYLSAALTGRTAESGTALHYLPATGAELPLPMTQFTLLGALCLVGSVWILVRLKDSRRAQALGIGVVSVYLWSLLSMLATVAGTTLLGFRLEPVLLALLGAAGVFGVVDGARVLYLVTSESPRVRTASVAVAVVGAVAFAQDIPHVLQNEITVAYTDTDGNGDRADRRPPGVASYYGEVDAALQAARPGRRTDTVVLTSDTSFLAFLPYFGFQGLTSHYANPLAEFAARADAIESWSELTTPDELVAALDAAPWRAPDAFLFRRGADGYTLRLAEDVYPNDPNVRRYTVTFPESLFDDPRFDVQEIGPFVLVVRASGDAP
ncbi:galactan 5-O-arabinofuranosyltransferase [Rhodococcus kroppenstedtii]|nr:galactan 5-O-arabinofuranosyltransferase [Rhodococcus kroppenstedtii]MDV7198429.1 galactan 5-O-arabinofuranosyltransferase [Rhodococcus kroppenstedtii]